MSPDGLTYRSKTPSYTCQQSTISLTFSFDFPTIFDGETCLSLLLEGKRAFISGGTRGIGAALCEVFAREGADIAFNYHSSDDLADQVRSNVESYGRKALSFKVSVTDRFGMKHTAREIRESWGAVDILVNNAAVNKPDNFATTTDKSWDWVVDTNVNSLFAVTKPFYKQMIRERAGTILNITSIGAIRALPTSVHYATSKAAMIGFTKCLSREAANFGITVNAIAAGIFDTDLGNTLPERLLEAHENWVSLRRLGRPVELAEFAAFIVSPRNSYMNGEVITVDGGTIT
ncbi:MAG TPA: beta-ketoacyl-ACP reductase [Blastocatellia bacterium]|nr:beta-ketoacyl-ACP reductase [Blastocatellia bacterium]